MAKNWIARSLLASAVFTASAVAADCESRAEAELLALEVSAELLPPQELVAQIDADLLTIRQAFPAMDSICLRPSWRPGQIIVGLTDAAAQDYSEGQYGGWDALNEEYQPTAIDLLFAGAYVLTFARDYNSFKLAELYSAAAGVSYTEPNFLVGDGDDISSPMPGVYEFRKAWGDCPAGCIYEHLWTYRIEGETVRLLQESGDPFEFPTSIARQSWGRVKERQR